MGELNEDCKTGQSGAKRRDATRGNPGGTNDEVGVDEEGDGECTRQSGESWAMEPDGFARVSDGTHRTPGTHFSPSFKASPASSRIATHTSPPSCKDPTSPRNSGITDPCNRDPSSEL